MTLEDHMTTGIGEAPAGSESALTANGGYRRLLSNRSFRNLWIGQTISGVGDWLVIGLLIPLVTKLARASGAREQRWAHLLCGPVDATQTGASRSTDGTSGNTAERLDRLETEVAQLRETVQKLCSELGLSPAGQT